MKISDFEAKSWETGWETFLGAQKNTFHLI
jgi:hypothetical protein